MKNDGSRTRALVEPWKWDVLHLEPGQELTISYPNEQEACKARQLWYNQFYRAKRAGLMERDQDIQIALGPAGLVFRCGAPKRRSGRRPTPTREVRAARVAAEVIEASPRDEWPSLLARLGDDLGSDFAAQVAGFLPLEAPHEQVP